MRASIAPCSRGLPRLAGGSASALSLSSCSGFTHVTARRIARSTKATVVARLRPDQLPNQAARQLADQSTTLRVEPSSAIIRAFGNSELMHCNIRNLTHATIELTASIKRLNAPPQEQGMSAQRDWTSGEEESDVSTCPAQP